MARFLIPTLAALALTACSQAPATPSPDADPVSAPATEAVVPTTASAPALSVEASCRQAVETLYGQSGTAVTFDASDFSVSWPAPVDG